MGAHGLPQATLSSVVADGFNELFAAALRAVRSHTSLDAAGHAAHSHRVRDALGAAFAGDCAPADALVVEYAERCVAIGAPIGVSSAVARAVADVLMGRVIAAFAAYELPEALSVVTRIVAGRTGVFATAYVAASHASLRAFATEVERVREDERRRLAREIHDDLGQRLTGLKFDIARARRRLAGAAQTAELFATLDAMTRAVDASIGCARKLASELRPPVLDDLSVEDAIEWLVRDFEQRAGLTVDLDLPNDDVSVSGDTSTTLFRCLQELLRNVAQHASASRVTTRLARDGDALVLQVEDDGCGVRGDLNDQVRHPGLGLAVVRERIATLHGSLSVIRAEHRGTIATIRVPLGAS